MPTMMPMKPADHPDVAFDIVVLGELNADLILRGDVEPAWAQAEKLIDDMALELGGSSAIFACGAAKLGLRVAFVGVIGDDMIGRFCREALERSGVDTRGLIVDSSMRTGMTIILQKPDDRAMFTYLGTIAALAAERIDPQLIASARHLHVGAYWLQQALQPGLADLFQAARAKGITTSLDTNWDPAEQWRGLEPLLAATDMLLPNEAEASAIASALVGRLVDTTEALELLLEHVPTVALKRGGDGALAAHGNERTTAAPLPITFVDAVGAGDSFDAGFIAARLLGWSLVDSLKLGIACGSLSTRAAGGTAAQPTLAEATAALGMGIEG